MTDVEHLLAASYLYTFHYSWKMFIGLTRPIHVTNMLRLYQLRPPQSFKLFLMNDIWFDFMIMIECVLVNLVIIAAVLYYV